jgi:hypothetical protein
MLNEARANSRSEEDGVVSGARLWGLIMGVAGLSACGGVEHGPPTADPLPSVGDVSEAEWAALADRKVFFGHQSVGENIMAGIADVLASNPQIRLTVLETKDLDSARAPAFVHAPVGRNYFPFEKIDEFASLSGAGFGAEGGVAMVKLCFVDIESGIGADSLFAEYQRRMAGLRAEHPGLTIVHFTMPLTVIEGTKGYLIRKLRRQPTSREHNLVRNRYNDLLRAEYEGREPVFDIARLESTLPSGERVYFRDGADTVYVLAEQYTDDGAHLNAASRRMVAEQLLIMLARLPQPAPAPGQGTQ